MPTETETERAERIAELRQKVAAVKKIISQKTDPDDGRRNNVSCHRWQPGQSGNPHGQPIRSRPKFWLYVTAFLDMTKTEANGIDEDGLTLAQLGAKVFAFKVAEGKWAMTKEVIDRELGRIPVIEEESEGDVPRLIRLPFKMVKEA